MTPSGRRTALLVGATAPDLRGVDDATRAMEGVAERSGFATTTLLGRDATRAGVLDAFDEIAEAARHGDPILFYYAGHARFVERSEVAVDGLPPIFLELHGTWESSESDPRMLFGFEIAKRLVELHSETGNVTAVFDCCHAQGVVPIEMPNAHVIADAMAEAIRKIEERRSVKVRAVEALGQIVCVFATSAHERAWGLAGISESNGLFSRCLAEALDHAPPQATWAHVVSVVRDAVMRERPHQRPVVAGPSLRRIFSVVEASPPAGAHPAALLSNGDWVVETSEGLLANVGDRYRIVDLAEVSRIATVVGDSENRVAMRCGEPRSDAGCDYGWASPLRSDPVWARFAEAARNAHDDALSESIAIELGSGDPLSITVRHVGIPRRVYAAALSVDDDLVNLTGPHESGVVIVSGGSENILISTDRRDDSWASARIVVVVSDRPMNLGDLQRSKLRTRDLFPGPSRATWVLLRTPSGAVEKVALKPGADH